MATEKSCGIICTIVSGDSGIQKVVQL